MGFGKLHIILILGCVTFAPVYSQSGMQLAYGGKSKYSIVLAKDADSVERDAATILQDYFGRVTNIKLPIVSVESPVSMYQIVVGKSTFIDASEAASLGDDGFIIRQIKNTLILTGGVRKGTLYAIYTFLEDYLGCQAFTYKFIKVPKQHIIELPVGVNRKEIPSFQYRMTFFPDAQSFEYCDWRKLNNFYEGWGMWVHSFNQLLPPEKYFKQHPEYFALRGKVRKPTQPCLSNPDVYKIILSNLSDTIRKNPTAKYWSVSQNDNLEYCQCSECNKKDVSQDSHQGSLLSFVNRIAENFPKKTISTLAYKYSEKPPKTLIPKANVMVMLCTYSYEDRAIPIAGFSLFDTIFSQWSKLTKQLFIWEYATQFEHFNLPFPNILTLQSNIQYFSSKSPRYLFLQGHGIYWAEFSELKCYLISKLMWNPNVDVNATVESFLNNYYGASAAQYINQYITQLYQNALNANNKITSHGLSADYFTGYLSLSSLASYKILFKKALASVDHGSSYYTRIEKEYASVLYGELENYKWTATHFGTLSSSEREDYNKILNEWYSIIQKVDAPFLNEASLHISTYFQNSKDVLRKLGAG